MILIGPARSRRMLRIPRESGDDPVEAAGLVEAYWYSPRERG